MAGIFKNARSALQDFFLGRRQTAAADTAIAGPVPASTQSPLSKDLAAAFKRSEKSRVPALLRPQPGLAAALRDLHRDGVFGSLFPDANLEHSLRAIQSLEQLRSQTSISGERFGSMLRELEAPELLVIALLLRDAGPDHSSGDTDQTVAAAQPTLDLLGLAGDARQTVEFLLRHQLKMSMIAFRQDTSDPSVIGTFVELFSTEERLKMLCLMTIADLSATAPEALTPWKAEILWRLFVDTYNHMTMTYG